jgi:hypothetical protein
MNPPIDKQAAVMRANRLRLYARLPHEQMLAEVIWKTIANPQATPELLLILADALRDPLRPTFTAIANDIAALTPTRAIPTPQEP